MRGGGMRKFYFGITFCVFFLIYAVNVYSVKAKESVVSKMQTAKKHMELNSFQNAAEQQNKKIDLLEDIEGPKEYVKASGRIELEVKHIDKATKILQELCSQYKANITDYNFCLKEENNKKKITAKFQLNRKDILAFMNDTMQIGALQRQNYDEDICSINIGKDIKTLQIYERKIEETMKLKEPCIDLIEFWTYKIENLERNIKGDKERFYKYFDSKGNITLTIKETGFDKKEDADTKEFPIEVLITAITAIICFFIGFFISRIQLKNKK
jgi:hypothetical protein